MRRFQEDFHHIHQSSTIGENVYCYHLLELVSPHAFYLLEDKDALIC